MAVNQEKEYSYELVSSEGLTRRYRVSMGAEPVAVQANEVFNEIRKDFKMPGFNRGNVPMNIIRKQKGKDVIQDVITKFANRYSQEIFKKEGIRPSSPPKVEVTDFDDQKHLIFTVEVKVLPDVPQINWEGIKLKMYNISISDADLEKAHQEIIKNFHTFNKASADAAAKKGDTVVLDYKGSVGGKDFEGSKAENIRLELGSNTFVPGFEDQLIGAKAGSDVQVKVVFPKQYHDASAAGKEAIFEVHVKEILNPEGVAEINDEFAKKLGLESREKLDEMLRDKIRADYYNLARMLLKKQLFDYLDTHVDFEMPEEMVKMDQRAIINQIEIDYNKNPSAFGNRPISEVKEEYQKIAKRRVKCGIILASLIQELGIEVSEEDLQQAVALESMQRPGQERQVIEFYKNPANLERLRGPIAEEKAIDAIIEKITLEETETSSEDFIKNHAGELNELPHDMKA